MSNYLKNFLMIGFIFIFYGVCLASEDTTIANRESSEIAKAVTSQNKTVSNQQSAPAAETNTVTPQAVIPVTQTSTLPSQAKKPVVKQKTKKKIQEAAPVVQQVVPVVQEKTAPSVEKNNFNNKNEDDILFEAFLVMAKRGDVPGLEFFLSKGLDINKKYQDTAVILEAAKNNKLEAVDYISQNKCNLDVTNDKSISALRYAVENGNDEIVQLLLDNKCDPNIQDKENLQTPLMVSLEKRLDKITALLLNTKKINVNLTDKEGRNALMVAIACSNLSAVEKIIDKKANVFAVDKNGKSVLNIAESIGDEEIIKVVKNTIGKKEAEQKALEKKANKKKKSQE
jgi:ankyrin repeat protein